MIVVISVMNIFITKYFSFQRESQGENTVDKSFPYTIHTSKLTTSQALFIIMLSCYREMVYQVTLRPNFHVVCSYLVAICFYEYLLQDGGHHLHSRTSSCKDTKHLFIV